MGTQRRFYRTPTIYVLSKNMKIIQKSTKNFHFYSREKLHGRVFVMVTNIYILQTCAKIVPLTLDLEIVFTEACISLLQIKDSGILIRTSSMRRFYRVPTPYVLSKNKKKKII